MPRLPIPGQDAEQWGALLNEFLRVAHQEDGTIQGLPLTPPSMAALRTAPVPADQSSALLLGYYTPADNGGGSFVFDATANLPDNGGTIVRPDTIPDGAPGRWRRLVQDYLSVRWFGARGDGNGSDLAPFRAAIEALGPVDTALGGTLYVPPGIYRLDGDLHLNRQMILAGATAGGRAGVSRLRFDPGCGLIVDYVADLNRPGGRRGDATVIRDLYLRASGKGAVKDGIFLNATATIEHCYIVGFSGNGIHIQGVGDVTNANLWSIRNCGVEDNDGHGLYVHGADSNAGIGTGINAVANGGWGIYDSSFLGNTYIGCHTSTNRGGAYKVEGGTNFSVLMGCYSESDQPASVVHQVSLVLGGDHGAGFVDPPPTESAPGLRLLHGRNVSGFTVVSPGSPRLEIGIGTQANTALVWQSRHDTHEYRLRYQPESGWWEAVWANSNRYAAFALSGGKTAAGPDGAGYIKFPRGYFLGDGLYQRKIANASGLPTSGQWTVGDIVYNTDPVTRDAAGHRYIGWVCMQTGAPGVWKPFGLIAE